VVTTPVSATSQANAARNALVVMTANGDINIKD
jgi:hypothetical protein